MTLQEAIEEVRQDVEYEGEYSWYNFEGSPGVFDFNKRQAQAIAIILNAVVKGELK